MSASGPNARLAASHAAGGHGSREVEPRSLLYYYRRMRTFSRPARLALVAVAVVALSGCLSSDTDVTLDADGSGTIELTYIVDTQAWDTGVFDDSDVARPVPIARTEFQQTADMIEGLELRSHRISRDDDLVTVDARLRFDSPSALERMLGRGALELDVRDDGGSWRYTVAPGGGSDGEQARLLAEQLAGYTLSFRLRTPAPIVATTGETDGERNASFTASLADVATAAEPIVWEVRW